LAFLEGRLEGLRSCRSTGDPAAAALAYATEWRHDVSDRADDPAAERTYLTLHWLVGKSTDAADALALEMLSTILLGNQGAPLRKGVIESKLGQDLAFSGFSADMLESTFHVGLKGAEAARARRLRSWWLDSLEEIARREHHAGAGRGGVPTVGVSLPGDHANHR